MLEPKSREEIRLYGKSYDPRNHYYPALGKSDSSISIFCGPKHYEGR